MSITKPDAASTTEAGTIGDDLDKEAGLGSLPSSPVSSTVSSGLVSSAANAATSGPRIDRSVASRTQFQITLPLSTGSCSQGATSTGGTGDTNSPFDQRGWSSPHGEPYRPLGKPDLSLKFSPRLADGSSLLQNAHRMKVFEGKDAGDKDNKGGSELRHATGVHSHSAVGGSGGSSGHGPGSASRPGLFEMFPLNFANKKRPLDERQVKLAHRLYASTTNYSPGKVRGLRRNLQNHHFEEQQHTHFDAALSLSSTQFDRTQQSSFHQGDESVELLRHAIRECSSRLRAVKNGASFLAQVSSSEHLDLLHLQEEYHREPHEQQQQEERDSRPFSSFMTTARHQVSAKA
uniref:Uncharacterized protein n=1 Tax=Globisporangium ultimum (strain ATCC 200006 / CBS 805.95 / DAOM BR144) TaxID=431595 RepID=K3XAU9_GLOUD